MDPYQIREGLHLMKGFLPSNRMEVFRESKEKRQRVFLIKIHMTYKTLELTPPPPPSCEVELIPRISESLHVFVSIILFVYRTYTMCLV